MCLLTDKRDAPDEAHMPNVKAEQIGTFDSTGVVANSVVTALPKDSETRFILSPSVFLAQELNYLSCFPLCICILVDSNSCRNVFKMYFWSSKDTFAQAEYQPKA